MEHNHPPSMERAVYTQSNGFGSSLIDVAKATTNWLFRHLLEVTRSPCIFMTGEGEENSYSLSHACREIDCTATHDPASLVTFNDSYTNLRRKGVRGLLVRMVRQSWPPLTAQLALCELIDLARMDSNTVLRLCRHGQHQVLHRIANLINFFSGSSRAMDVNSPLLSVQGDSRRSPEEVAPLDLTVPDNSGTEETEPIMVSDGEDSSDQSVELRPDSPIRPIPRCCVEHRAHCCCCYKRRSAGHMPTTEFAQMFREFIHFYERRRKYRRRNPPVRRMLNRPSSPIEISDSGSEVEESSEPQPGPSRPREAEIEAITASAAVEQRPMEEEEMDDINAEEEEEEQSRDPPSSPAPTIDRPTTANEFYFLLNQALKRSEQEGEVNPPEARESQPAAPSPQPSPVRAPEAPRSSSPQPVVKKEDVQTPPRPNSAL